MVVSTVKTRRLFLLPATRQQLKKRQTNKKNLQLITSATSFLGPKPSSWGGFQAKRLLQKNLVLQ